MSERRRATSLSPPERFLLEQWALSVKAAFGELPYLVGSVARAESWRDVDVRLMLDDDAYEVLVDGRPARIAALNVAMSLWGQQATGLPIDFQFQDNTATNADTAGQRRVPLGLMAIQRGTSA